MLPPRALAVAMVGSIAVALQFLQREDSTFPLLYFTVDSVLLLSLGLVLSTNTLSQLGGQIRAAGEAGTVVSAIIYWLLLAPTNGLGSEVLTVMANVALHAIVPILLVALLFDSAYPQTNVRTRMVALWFPCAYLLLVAMPVNLGAWDQPYDFLEPEAIGWIGVTASVLGVGLLYVAAGHLLSLLGAKSHGSTRVRFR